MLLQFWRLIVVGWKNNDNHNLENLIQRLLMSDSQTKRRYEKRLFARSLLFREAVT